MKSVVTGGKGFIGSHIVRALRKRGDEVVVVDLPEHDIRRYDSIEPAFTGASIVFHQAALPRVQYSIQYPLESMEVNVQGTAVILRAAHEAGVNRVVLASSGSVYGDQAVMPLVETMTPSPKSPYGLHKVVLEMLAKLWSEVYGLETVSMRYFNVYGPGMDQEGAYALAIGKFLKQRKEGKPITIWGDGSHSRDFTHVRDVVRANLFAAESEQVGRGEVINIGAGKNRTVLELAGLVGGPVVHEEERLEPAHALADNRLAKELLGWEPEISLEDGIAELKKLHGLA